MKMKSVVIVSLAITLFACNVEITESTSDAAPMDSIGNVKHAAILKDITPYDAIQELAVKDWQVLDVRTPEEWAEGILEGATLINIYDDDFIHQVSTTLNMDKPVLVYCKAGARSAQAIGMIAEAGFIEVYNLDGGIIAWEAKGLPVIQ